MKILVVDDSPVIAELICIHVESFGFTPIHVPSGQEAIDYLAGHEEIDMLLMDVEMPGLNGYTTTEIIREQFKDRWMPIIFLTGKTNEEDLQKGIECGGDDYLTKPVNSVILNAKLTAMSRILDMRNELADLNLKLEEMAVTDLLTQILNRRGFENYASDQWRDSARRHTPISLIMMDIDYFKLYNDNYGHVGGDSCLHRFAQGVATSLRRPMDKVGRYGGEEFIVILPNTDADGALLVANNILQAIKEEEIHHALSDVSNLVTASLGVSTCYNPDIQTYEDIVANADKALYQAKKNGRNQVKALPMDLRKKIMIIDDNLEDLNLTRVVLDGTADVYTFDSGEDCVRRAHEIQPDLILLDIVMEGLDGLDVCRLLKEDETTSAIPVVLISLSESEDAKSAARTARANGYISKPFKPEELMSKVQRYIQ